MQKLSFCILEAIKNPSRGRPGNEARSTRDFTCASLAPRPMTVVFSLGTRLRVRMRTTFENGVLRNGQQSVSAVNNFIDQGEFGAMKTLSDRIAPRCDKNKFCDKITVSTRIVFELSLFEQSGRNEEEEEEKWHFCNRTLSRLAYFRVAVGHLCESC